MSFRCQNCYVAQASGICPTRVVTKKRDKEYREGKRGWEIAEEMNLCSSCVGSVGSLFASPSIQALAVSAASLTTDGTYRTITGTELAEIFA